VNPSEADIWLIQSAAWGGASGNRNGERRTSELIRGAYGAATTIRGRIKSFIPGVTDPAEVEDKDKVLFLLDKLPDGGDLDVAEVISEIIAVAPRVADKLALMPIVAGKQMIENGWSITFSDGAERTFPVMAYYRAPKVV